MDKFQKYKDLCTEQITPFYQNAIVKSCDVTRYNGSILLVNFDFRLSSGTGQGWQPALGVWNETLQRRVDHLGFTHEILNLILELFEVAELSKVKGKPCRLIKTSSDIKDRDAENNFISGIGHFLDDKWIVPENLALELEVERDVHDVSPTINLE